MKKVKKEVEEVKTPKSGSAKKRKPVSDDDDDDDYYEEKPKVFHDVLLEKGRKDMWYFICKNVSLLVWELPDVEMSDLHLFVNLM